LSQLKVGAVHAGYVASVTDAGCFVRFLGRLTGLAPVPQLADTFVTDPKQHFAPGQSVHAAVLDVDEGRQRVMLSLKPSACGGGGASGAALLGTLLADLETAHTLNPTADVRLATHPHPHPLRLLFFFVVAPRSVTTTAQPEPAPPT
jgi:transcriptional accessory protein Tex/SPT6